MNPELFETDIARDHHEGSKLSAERVRPPPRLLGLTTPPRRLDWANQPTPFRWFEGAPERALPKGAARLGATHEVLGRLLEPPPGAEPALDLDLLGRLLFHSVAISAWKEARRSDGSVERWSVRVNPSSGNLHPTETYLAVRGARALEDGLYHYRVDRHSLELRRRGDAVRALLAAAGRTDAGVGAVLAVTTIIWREAWKYGDRAWRYSMLDAGHAAHALLLAARGLGLAGGILARFDDGLVTRALACEGNEVPVLLVPIGSPDALAPLVEAGRGRAVELGPPLGRPNALSRSEPRFPLIERIVAATHLDGEDLARAPGTLPAARELARPVALPAPELLSEDLAVLVRRRRSAIDLDRRRSRLSLPALAALLAAARRPVPFDALHVFWGRPRASAADGLSLHVWAHAVSGFSPGLSRAAPGGQALELVRPGDLRDEAAFVSLEQEIAGDGALTFAIVADLESHLAAQGCRGYRDAFVLAGVLGHALYLAAHASGSGATAMGAFYDDASARALGLDPRDGAPVYHFAVGEPVPDERIAS
jgi:SagB-type dehydrogenase family enzyme